MSPYTFAIASGGLPPGLSLNPSTGAITGTPTTAGPFNFTVKVTDAAGGTATTLGCHITIAAPAAPSLSFQCPTGLGQVGVPYNSSFVPSGGTAPYKFAIISWGLPSPGLNLNPLTGAITGTPTTANPIVFTATVTDATGATFKGSCPIVIEPKMAVSCPGANGQTEEEYSSSSRGQRRGVALYVRHRQRRPAAGPEPEPLDRRDHRNANGGWTVPFHRDRHRRDRGDGYDQRLRDYRYWYVRD